MTSDPFISSLPLDSTDFDSFQLSPEGNHFHRHIDLQSSTRLNTDRCTNKKNPDRYRNPMEMHSRGADPTVKPSIAIAMGH